MFEIDLRRSIREERSASGREGAGREAVLAFLPVALLVALVLAVLTISSWRVGQRIEETEKRVATLETRVEASRQQLATIGPAREAIGASEQEVYWSDVLRLLSEKTPDKVWITQMKVVTTPAPKENQPPSRALRLEGGVLSAASEGNLDEIGRYLQELQADPRFARYFAEPELGAVTRAGGDQYALSFTVTIPFADA